jgi:hypothetical protein
MSQNNNLVDQIVESSTLPGSGVEKKLEKLIQAAGYNKETIEMEDLRRILMNYLQDTFFDYPAA